jgi:hypothetical protein
MNKLFSSSKNTLISFIVLNGTISLLSLFLFFIKVWEASFVLFVSTIFDFLYLLVILNFGRNKEGKNGLMNSKNVLVFTILRTMIEIVSLAICALGIYFLPSWIVINDSYEKFKYAYILLGLIPYITAILFFYLNAKVEDR